MNCEWNRTINDDDVELLLLRNMSRDAYYHLLFENGQSDPGLCMLLS